jgi:murein DD-endopeptidase MepM/ murein hydrolase activator NlpD
MPIQSQLLAQPVQWMMFFVILCFTFFPSFSLGQGNPSFEWNVLYPKIRDRLISKEEAQGKLKTLESLIGAYTSQRLTSEAPCPQGGASGKCRYHYRVGFPPRPCYGQEGGASSRLARGQEDRLCFPLKGYTFHSIGGTKGNGYQAQGYDFFDGSQHKGHPGHDIFIRDKDQDGVDDRTGIPVDVLSVCSGVVVSVNDGWEPSSPVRGGNYVWIYHPIKGRYFYYAHLREIAVSVGQVVSRGDRLGTVGRTGLNAYPKRSPTHLHFSVHPSIDGTPRPMDPYFDLVRAEVR